MSERVIKKKKNCKPAPRTAVPVGTPQVGCGFVRVCVDSASKCLTRTAAYGHLNDCVADGPFKPLIHNPIKATLGEFCTIWLLIQYLSLCRMMDEVLSAYMRPCVSMCVWYAWCTCP